MASTASVGQNYSSIFAANLQQRRTHASSIQIPIPPRSPTKSEQEEEYRKLKCWARILHSFRRHRRHHSPLYVLLSMKMECQSKCAIDFDVVIEEEKCPDVVKGETTASAWAKVKTKTKIKTEAATNAKVDHGYSSSGNSSTSDYKSASGESSLDELTTSTEDEDEEEEKMAGDAISFAFIQFTFGQSPLESSNHFQTTTFKAKTVLNACTQMINFLTALDSLVMHYKELEKTERSLSFIIDELQEQHADVLVSTKGSERPPDDVGNKSKLYWCQYKLVHLGVFNSGPNYFQGPAKLAAAAKMVSTLKALISTDAQ